MLLGLGVLAYMAFIILRTLVYGVDVPGYASNMAMLLFFSGMNMLGLGILGEYVGRIFIEVKQRPVYLVRDAIGLDQPSDVGRGDAASGSFVEAPTAFRHGG